jgi:hypothetical protein
MIPNLNLRITFVILLFGWIALNLSAGTPAF